jgi:hypothetical protein
MGMAEEHFMETVVDLLEQIVRLLKKMAGE